MKWFSFYLFFFIFYLCTAWGDLSHQANHFNYYNLLAENLIKLNVEMPISPAKELLELKDPYNPTLNAPFRAHDLSLYNNKYYLYFGIVPALFFYVPYKLVFNSDLPDGIVVLTFSFFAFLFSAKLLDYLKNIYFKSVPEKIVGICIRVLGFGSFLGSLLRSPEIYEVAVSGGLFFVVSAMYFLLKEIKKEKLQEKYLLLISLLLGLGCGCRPQVIIIGGLLLLAFIIISFKQKKLTSINLFSITTPFLISLILLGFYNFIRFDSPFDFGLKYQLIADNFQNDFFSLKNLLVNVYFDWFHPLKVDFVFPFIHVNLMKLENVRTYGPGILFGIPFIWVTFIYLFVYLKPILKNKELISKFPIIEFFLLLIPIVVNCSIMLTMHGLAIRFLADFSIFIIITSSMIWFYFEYELTLKKIDKLNKISITLAIVSIVIGLALSIENPEVKLIFPSFNELMNRIKL